MKEPQEPYAASDNVWNYHIGLLRQWTEQKPESITAKVALASSYIAFGWHARGGGFANTVSPEGGRLFSERLSRGKDILMSVDRSQVCPNWYSEMQKIALGQGWDKESYENLFREAVAYEPTWYEYYKQKAFVLLPRWLGQSG